MIEKHFRNPTGWKKKACMLRWVWQQLYFSQQSLCLQVHPCEGLQLFLSWSHLLWPLYFHFCCYSGSVTVALQPEQCLLPCGKCMSEKSKVQVTSTDSKSWPAAWVGIRKVWSILTGPAIFWKVYLKRCFCQVFYLSGRIPPEVTEWIIMIQCAPYLWIKTPEHFPATLNILIPYSTRTVYCQRIHNTWH